MKIKSIWDKISFIGISAEEEFSHKEVVLLNKIIFLSSFLMLSLVPIEVVMNGWDLVPFEIGVSIFCAFAFVFNYYRKFTLAKFYYYFVVSIIIMIMGVVIGAGSGNELFLIPLFIFGALMFDKAKIYVPLALYAFLLFCLMPILQERIPPAVELSAELQAPFKYIMYAVSFTILFFAVYYFKNINFRFQQLLHTKNELIEEKNKEIVDSINYAERIQDAYLPPKELLTRLFSESFLLFKPKDIVSGDFYWFYSPESAAGKPAETVFVIAADCTGHGVPGAIMSVICCNAINETIINKRESDPGKILDDIRAQLIRILKTDQGTSRKDGMDASLCKFNLPDNTLEFAGANNPLWVIKKGEETVDVIKADRQPVGFYEGLKPFTTNKVQLKKGDRVFMFSDGYQDQFGGEKGKKFKASNLKRLLLAANNKKISVIHDRANEAFETWKGELEQVDDVVIVGIEL